MQIPGKHILLFIAAMVLLLATVSLVSMRHMTRDRFAARVDTVPPSGRKLQRDLPLSVRIEKSRAGRSPLGAWAWVLGGDGQPLYPAPLRLERGRDARGRLIEEVRFPPLHRIPPGDLLVALVVRLPDGPQSLARIEEALLGGSKELLQLHARVLKAARALGGHAEVVTAEVR